MPAGNYPTIGDGARRRLAEHLRRRVDGEVRFDDGSRALYATDASNYREVPIGVVIPRSVEAIARTVEVCRDNKVPIVHRGGGTSLAGQGCNTAVVIDSSKYVNAIIEIDAERRIGRVEPGCNLDKLRNAARAHGLTFGPDPSTHAWNTLGGMIGNNSGGAHSVMAGLTVDNVLALEVMTYDGTRLSLGPMSEEVVAQAAEGGGRRAEIYRGLRKLRDEYADLIRKSFPDIRRRVSGYNLDRLLPEHGFDVAKAVVGSEGTCVTVLEATLTLVPEPRHRVLLVVGFESVFDAGDAALMVREHGPIAIEGIDHRLVENMRKKHLHESDLAELPGGDAWLMVHFGADTEAEATGQAKKLSAKLKKNPKVQEVHLITSVHDREALWEVRESGLGATAFVPDEVRDHWPGWEDSAVAVADIGNYLRDLQGLYDKYGYHAALYGHFGDGLIHTRIDFGLHTREDVERFRRFMTDAAELVASYNGSLSGEHGDGQARGELLPIMFGAEIVGAFEQFKRIWDPDNRMNPGRVVHARPLDGDLRLGPRFRPPRLKAAFSYPDDHNSFARAVTRCVGVGKCRRAEGGTMCPSYRATREERYATRGRAHLLQEMLQGDPIRDRWKSEAVHKALDLCLACKGCKGDCPVNVDMATYKAEFLHHHFKSHARPRSAWSMGRIHQWSRLAEAAPWLANVLTQVPGLREVAKWVAGVHPDRSVPPFASHTFRSRWSSGRRQSPSKGLVVLWADTFNDHFTPEPLAAAADVLEAAGYRVELPEHGLCCGRPFYDYGFLPEARATLARTMMGLEEQLDRGAYIVGLEPSCMTVFKDEIRHLFPKDKLAKRLTERAMLLSEFVIKVADYKPPQVDRKAIFRAHCHQKAIFGIKSDQELLRRAGLDLEVLDDGCCGLAGAFGYETGKYDVSLKIAEDKTLPAVRKADPDTLIVCDGYSCREQILQLTERKVLTTAEVLQIALKEGKHARFPTKDRRYQEAERQATLVAAAGAVVIGVLVSGWLGQRQLKSRGHRT